MLKTAAVISGTLRLRSIIARLRIKNAPTSAVSGLTSSAFNADSGKKAARQPESARLPLAIYLYSNILTDTKGRI